MNGDGFADMIVGIIHLNDKRIDTGSDLVFSGCDTCGPIGVNYCGPASSSSTGQPAEVFAISSLLASDNSVILTANQLPHDISAYFLNTDVQQFTPFPPRLPGPSVPGWRHRAAREADRKHGGTGELVIQVDLTALPRQGETLTVLDGETGNFQQLERNTVESAWTRWPGTLPRESCLSHPGGYHAASNGRPTRA